MKKALKKFNEPTLYYKSFHLYDEIALKELEKIIFNINPDSAVMIKDDTFNKLLQKANLDYVEMVLNSSVCIKNILPEHQNFLFKHTLKLRKFNSSEEMIKFIDIFCNSKIFDINYTDFLEENKNFIISRAINFNVVNWLLENNSLHQNVNTIFELCLISPRYSIISDFIDNKKYVKQISRMEDYNILHTVLCSDKIYHLFKENNLLDSYLISGIDNNPLEAINFMWKFQTENFIDFMINHFKLTPNITEKLTIHDSDKLHFIEKLKLYKSLPEKLIQHNNKAKKFKI